MVDHAVGICKSWRPEGRDSARHSTLSLCCYHLHRPHPNSLPSPSPRASTSGTSTTSGQDMRALASLLQYRDGVGYGSGAAGQQRSQVDVLGVLFPAPRFCYRPSTGSFSYFPRTIRAAQFCPNAATPGKAPGDRTIQPMAPTVDGKIMVANGLMIPTCGLRETLFPELWRAIALIRHSTNHTLPVICVSPSVQSYSSSQAAGPPRSDCPISFALHTHITQEKIAICR